MKLDYKSVIALSEMSDDKLWARLRLLSSGMGVELPERRRSRIRYDALRCALRALTEDDIARINQILEIYRGRGKERYYGERYQ